MTKDEVLKVHSGVFYAALTSQNYAALEKLYSDDYMLVRPDGSVLNKQEVLQDLRSNGLRFHSIDPRQLVARVYGSRRSGDRRKQNRHVTEWCGEPRTLSIHRGLFARGRFDPACSFSKYHSR